MSVVHFHLIELNESSFGCMSVVGAIFIVMIKPTWNAVSLHHAALAAVQSADSWCLGVVSVCGFEVEMCHSAGSRGVEGPRQS